MCYSTAVFWLKWFNSLEQNENNPWLLRYTRDEAYLLSHTNIFILKFQVYFFWRVLFWSFLTRNPWVETQLRGSYRIIDFIFGTETKTILIHQCYHSLSSGLVTNKNQDLLFKLGFYIISVTLDLAFFIYMSQRFFTNNKQSFHSFSKYYILFHYMNSQ